MTWFWPTPGRHSDDDLRRASTLEALLFVSAEFLQSRANLLLLENDNVPLRQKSNTQRLPFWPFGLHENSRSVCRAGFLSVCSHTVSIAPQFARRKCPCKLIEISASTVGNPTAFTHSAATAAEANRHDAHRISQSEQNPPKPCPDASRLDPQHRLDHRSLRRAGGPVRSDLRWLLRRPLALSYLRT